MDDLLRAGLEEDHLIFDWTFTGTIVHNVGDNNPDFATGQITSATVTYTVENCLFRNSAVRDGGSIKQIGDRNISITQDEFSMADKVVEIPIVGVEVRQGDVFVDSTARSWKVIAMDICTLATRYRLALKAFA